MIDKIYQMMDTEGRFDFEDFNNACEEYLKSFRSDLSKEEFEKMGDAVYSISAIVRQRAYSIGFKTAVKIIIE